MMKCEDGKIPHGNLENGLELEFVDWRLDLPRRETRHIDRSMG